MSRGRVLRVLPVILGIVLAPSTRASTFEVTSAPAGVMASADDGNAPRNTVDKNLSTRWSARGDGQWIRYDLGASYAVAHVKIAFFRGDERQARFELQVSQDGSTWTTVWTGESSGSTTQLEDFDFTHVEARYVRYLGHGNSSNTWNSLTETEIYAIPHVYLGEDGRLVYVPYSNGDRIPDFSFAGYGGGGVALPDVPVKSTVSPGPGDDGSAIQAAIDEVSALDPDPDGFRGTVLLQAGTYEVAGGLVINTSGVVLRGEGDGPDGTVVRATGTARRTVFSIQGVGNRTEVAGTREAITDPYVPIGVQSFSVGNSSGLAVGDDVLIVRTPNQEWIDAIGMDSCTSVGTPYDTSDINGQTCLENPWTPSSRVMRYERKILAINANEVTIDAPVVEAIQGEFGGGYIAKYRFPGRIEKCGVEYLRSESDFVSPTDENHALRMISLSNVENAWLRNVTSVYFEQGTALVAGGAKYVTVQDSSSLEHRSQITGGRRYPFSLDDASFVLVMRCYARTGRHDYVTGSNTPGPNVFLDSRAEQSYSELGPHHRWATGSLFDSIIHQSNNGAQIMGAYNRGNSGTGHGWSGAYQLFWNCVGDTHRVSSPPYARNWSIGCQATRRQGTGEFESYGTPVSPWSLYLQQLRERLGDAAVANIGY